MLHIFFRRIEVEGSDHVPAAGPVLLVPNHTNSLVDPLFLLTALGRPVTLTAKNVLGKNPLLHFLFKGLGTIMFHRREDVGKGADPRQNVHALRRCREVLRGAELSASFPKVSAIPIQRCGLFTVERPALRSTSSRSDGNPGGLQIIPVGLLYTEKDQFRSAVWLRFGTPIDAARWHMDHPDGDAKALTDEIAGRVAALTMNYETRREVADPDLGDPDRPDARPDAATVEPTGPVSRRLVPGDGADAGGLSHDPRATGARGERTGWPGAPLSCRARAPGRRTGRGLPTPARGPSRPVLRARAGTVARRRAAGAIRGSESSHSVSAHQVHRSGDFSGTRTTGPPTSSIQVS